jgi:hypothetical protein
LNCKTISHKRDFFPAVPRMISKTPALTIIRT